MLEKKAENPSKTTKTTSSIQSAGSILHPPSQIARNFRKTTESARCLIRTRTARPLVRQPRRQVGSGHAAMKMFHQNQSFARADARRPIISQLDAKVKQRAARSAMDHRRPGNGHSTASASRPMAHLIAITLRPCCQCLWAAGAARVVAAMSTKTAHTGFESASQELRRFARNHDIRPNKPPAAAATTCKHHAPSFRGGATVWILHRISK